jgi:hypothetical protein
VDVIVSVCLEELDLQLPKKSMKKQPTEFQIPKTSMQSLMWEVGDHKNRPTFINELRGHDMDV